MSQGVVSTQPASGLQYQHQHEQANKAATASQDIVRTNSYAAISSRLRSNRASQDLGSQSSRESTAATTTTAAAVAVTAVSTNRDAHRYNAEANVFGKVPVESALPRMTRQRTAIVVPSSHHTESPDTNPQDEREELEDYSSHIEDEDPFIVGTPVEKICLCKPAPKIPRPRNAFILYRQSNQQNIKKANPNLTNPDISKVAGEIWRNETDEVKAIWKGLAEQEKTLHAQRYPDYRFEPKHRNRRSAPPTPSGERTRCGKCGGLGISSQLSPLPTPTSQPHSATEVRFALDHLGKALPASASSPVASPFSRFQHDSMMINTSGSHHGDPRYASASSPLTRKFPDGVAAERYEAKRRRFEELPSPSITRPEQHARMVPAMGGHAYTVGAHHAYPSPRTALESRRGSLPPPPHDSAIYYPPRTSYARPMDASSPRSAHGPTIMAPPPTRVSSMAGRTTGLHGYPATPTSGHHTQIPSYSTTRSRSDSESLRLAPLRPPNTKDQQSSVEAMIMGVPVIGKIASLRRVAPPIREPSATSPVHPIRGSIVAIEGADEASAETLRKQLETILKRNDEFDIRVMESPKFPAVGDGYSEYHNLTAEWLKKSKEMVDFVTGREYQQAHDQRADSVSMVDRGMGEEEEKQSHGGEDVMDTDPEDSEVLEHPRRLSHDLRIAARIIEQKRREQQAPVDQGAQRQNAAASQDKEAQTVPRQRIQHEHAASTKIPLLIISSYMLHACDTWSIALPINDLYSPVDHWTWAATLWRACVGPDLTVYVRSTEKELEIDPVSATSTTAPPNSLPATSSSAAPATSSVTGGTGTAPVPAGPNTAPSTHAPLQEKKVEIKEEIGAIIVKKENGRVQDDAVRRVAFEIGEWVRLRAG